MIPTTKKDFEQMKIDSTAKVLLWTDLSDNDRAVYMHEAEWQQKEERPWIIEEWSAHIAIVEHEAIILAWNDLDKKEQQAYTTKAQKHISKQKEKDNETTTKQ